MSESICSLARKDNHAAQRVVRDYVTDKKPGIGLFAGLIIAVAIAILMGIGLKSISTQPIEYFLLAVLEVAPVGISIVAISFIIQGYHDATHADREFSKPLNRMEIKLRNAILQSQIYLANAYNSSNLCAQAQRYKNDHITLRDLLQDIPQDGDIELTPLRSGNKSS